MPIRRNENRRSAAAKGKRRTAFLSLLLNAEAVF